MSHPDQPRLDYRKSSYTGETGQCVELARAGVDAIAVRDSKNPEGPRLEFTAAAFRDLLDWVKSDRDLM
jgi:hypothetical protein